MSQVGPALKTVQLGHADTSPLREWPLDHWKLFRRVTKVGDLF